MRPKGEPNPKTPAARTPRNRKVHGRGRRVSGRNGRRREAPGETGAAVDHLSNAPLAHLKYEKEELVEPIATLTIPISEGLSATS
jgi:hypothetical protein